MKNPFYTYRVIEKEEIAKTKDTPTHDLFRRNKLTGKISVRDVKKNCWRVLYGCNYPYYDTFFEIA